MKKNIYQKLVEVRKEVTYLQKNKSGYSWKYVCEAQVLGAIRSKLDELGIVIHMDMVSVEEKTILIKGKEHVAIKVHFLFTWVNSEDPKDTIKTNIYLEEVGVDSKIIGSMMTYASKYHLFRNLSIPMSEMDPDQFKVNVAGESIVDEQAFYEEWRDKYPEIEKYIKAKSEYLKQSREITISNCLKDIESFEKEIQRWLKK